MSAKTASQIDAEAADWAARVDRGSLTAGQEQAFQAWLSEDVRCMGAFGRMRALALSTERAKALGSRFGTGKGEMKVVALKDGSVVTLNTASEIVVNYSEKLRSVELIHGEALFDVAKNKARPFVVAAGDTSVRVVGTSFSVRRFDAAPIQILVREGIVEVFKPTGGVKPIRISANTMALAPPDDADIAARPVPAAQLHRAMAWQEGQIAFEGETLAQAVTEFSRYSDTRIVIDDPALAREEIAGLFKATDPVGFAQTIAISLNVHARIGEGEVRLTR
jgi:transmembrane sensor